MKRIALLLFLLFCACKPAGAENYVLISQDDENAIYLDIDSISQHSSDNYEYVAAWVKWIPTGESRSLLMLIHGVYSIDYISQHFAFDKESRRMQLLITSVYNKLGKVDSARAWQFSPDDYQDLEPETAGEDIYNAVMERYNRLYKDSD